MIKALFLFAAIYGGGVVFIITQHIGSRLLPSRSYRLVGRASVGLVKGDDQ